MGHLAEWSVRLSNHTTTTTLLNYDHKSIYSNGIIVTQNHHTPPVYTLEVVTSVPFDPLKIEQEPESFELTRTLGYCCKRNDFVTSPIEMFQTAGYEQLSQYSLTEVDSYLSYSQGIEVHIYPRLDYMEVVERHPINEKKV